MLSDLTIWLIWIAIAAAFAALIWIAARALFNDRPNGRRRCPRCWYDLSYSPGMRCAECGHVAHHERQLHRTRRHWGPAVLAIGACVALAGYVHYIASARGFIRNTPSGLLIASLPFVSDTNSTIYREIARRVRQDALSDGAWESLLDRSIRGDWRTDVNSDEWVEKYGQIIADRRAQLQSKDDAPFQDEIREALLELPPRIKLDVAREVLPSGLAGGARIRVDNWWPGDFDTRVSVTPQAPGAITTTFFRGANDFRDIPSYIVELPPLAAGTTELAIDVEVERRLTDAAGEWQAVHRETYRMQIEVSDKQGSVMSPLVSAELDAVLYEVFSEGVEKWPGGPSPVRVDLREMNRTFVPQWNGIAIGIRVDIMHGASIARTLNLWWRAGDDDVSPHYGGEVVEEDYELLMSIRPNDPTWRLRITGQADLAHRVPNATRYWAGQIMLPVGVDMRRNRAPQPPYWNASTGAAVMPPPNTSN